MALNAVPALAVGCVQPAMAIPVIDANVELLKLLEQLSVVVVVGIVRSATPVRMASPVV